jgi:hypothetical protein
MVRCCTRPESWPSFIQRGDPLAYGLATPDGLVKAGLHGIGPVIHPDDRPSVMPHADLADEALGLGAAGERPFAASRLAGITGQPHSWR